MACASLTDTKLYTPRSTYTYTSIPAYMLQGQLPCVLDMDMVPYQQVKHAYIYIYILYMHVYILYMQYACYTYKTQTRSIYMRNDIQISICIHTYVSVHKHMYLQ